MDLTWLLYQISGLDPPPRSPEGRPRPLVKVSRGSLEGHPAGVVSAVLTRLTEVGYEQLTDAQRGAWLVATYDRTVQNEGHEEYFRAFGVGRASEVQAALATIGTRAHACLLDDAIKRHMSAAGETGFVNGPAPAEREAARPRDRPQYADLDAAIRGLGALTARLLQDHVLLHLAEFVEVQE
jgi:hypothetical protein